MNRVLVTGANGFVGRAEEIGRLTDSLEMTTDKIRERLGWVPPSRYGMAWKRSPPGIVPPLSAPVAGKASDSFRMPSRLFPGGRHQEDRAACSMARVYPTLNAYAA